MKKMGRPKLPDGQQKNITSRVHKNLIKRLDALTNSSIITDPQLAPRGTLSRADVIRLALERGVSELEKKSQKKGA
jgi:hypothetical protein